MFSYSGCNYVDSVFLNLHYLIAVSSFLESDNSFSCLNYFYMQACIQVCPKNPANFNVDNVRVAKLLGGGLHDCTIVRGMVMKGDAQGSIKRMEKAKVGMHFNLPYIPLYMKTLLTGFLLRENINFASLSQLSSCTCIFVDVFFFWK